MTTQEFYRRVKARLNLADEAEAKTATRVVLAATADRINRPEAKDLASQLPKELADLVKGRGGPVQKMDAYTFVSRIQGDLDLANYEQAATVTSAVFSVLKEAVSEGEWEDIVSQFPRGLQEMFVMA